MLEKINSRTKFIKESPLHDEAGSEEDHLGHVMGITNTIADNLLYVTSTLATKYEAWYQVGQPYIKESKEIEYETWQNSHGNSQDEDRAYYTALPEMLDMVTTTKHEFDQILDCIHNDIREIRSNLEQPLSFNTKKEN